MSYTFNNLRHDRPGRGLRNHFVAAWILYWIIAAALPVSGVESMHEIETVFLQLCFVAMVFVGLSLPSAGSHEATAPQPPARDITHWIAWSLLLGGVGLLLQLYDKVLVQEIDYSQGIAAAREQWRELGEDRIGQASSLASVVAYLVGNAHFITILLLLHERCTLRTKHRLMVWALVMLLLVGNLLLTGGRSGLLFVLSFVCAMCARRGNCFGALIRLPLRWIVFGGAAGFACVGYALYVFSARATLSELSPHQYTLEFLPYLGMSPSQGLEDLDPNSPWSSLLSLTTLAGSYLIHSFFSMTAILDVPPEGSGLLFSHVQTLIAKSGVLDAPAQAWFLSGRFPSLPGALYHQWGSAGILIGGFAIGLISRLVSGWHSARSEDLLPLVAYGLMHAVLVLSPLLLAADFLNFPFIATSACAVSIFALLNLRIRPNLRSARSVS